MENKIQELQKEIINNIILENDKALFNFFEPYIRLTGIKGEITKGKLKYRGIKLKVRNDLKFIDYQLNQRGIDISPVFTIKYNYEL
jgi:hypothetical protein